MNFKNVATVLAAVSALFAQSAMAQTAAPVTRADVKAETAAAKKKGEAVGAGEAAMPQAKPAGKSEVARADVKAAAAGAKKKGDKTEAGEAVTPQGKPAAKSDKARADVKAETAAAKKKGDTLSAGEAAPKK